MGKTVGIDLGTTFSEGRGHARRRTGGISSSEAVTCSLQLWR